LLPETERMGAYVVAERIDKGFLKRQFGGILVRPVGRHMEPKQEGQAQRGDLEGEVLEQSYLRD
jgi:hypothetical protein